MLKKNNLRYFLITAILPVLVASTTPTYSEDLTSKHRFGLGVIFGEPTGFTGKYFFDRHLALDAGITYSFLEYFHLYSDILWHFPSALNELNKSFSNVSPYMGAGLGLRLSSRSKPDDGDARANAFFRIPLGLEWRPKFPVGVFLEFAPGLAFAPKIYGFVQGGVGIRYYF